MTKRARAGSGELRSAPLGLRIKPSLKAELDRLALADQRTLAGYVEIVLEAHVEAMKAHEKDAPGSRLRGAKAKR